MPVKKTNAKFHKNEKKGEIKSHHYILSFDPRDKEENGLTAKEAQRMGMEFASQNFSEHQVLVCTHVDGHNGSGNIHVQVMTICQKRQLYQVDLRNPALDKVTEQEYWAERRGQEKLDKRNAEITKAGLTPPICQVGTTKKLCRNCKQFRNNQEYAKNPPIEALV